MISFNTVIVLLYFICIGGLFSLDFRHGGQGMMMSALMVDTIIAIVGGATLYYVLRMLP